MLLVSGLAFVVLLTLLILIHELGHFAVARLAGVTVEEFGFGLPPRVKTIARWRGTLFSLNWIPFGGFVRLKGESALSPAERRQPGNFSAASIPARIAILLAGVAMNFFLAIVLLLVGFSIGRWIPTYTSLPEMQAAADRGEIHLTLGVVIDEVASDGTAATAGVPTHAFVLAVDGTSVKTPEDVVALQSGKKRVTYTLAPSEGETRDVLVPLAAGKAGIVLRTAPRELSADRRPLPEAFLLAMRETRVVTTQTVRGVGHLVESLLGTGVVPEGITGIVGIARLTHASVQEGFLVYLRLVALLSLSLAVLNVLPFPALDGGRILFVLFEAVFRHPIARRIELGVNSVGFVLLLLLILFVTFYDVLRLFR
ncbi:MAG: regulator of sigma E protease [Candidatus Peregrinibacteria bacterium Gr01-1014_25]|nr:MAG: regulator of sigma E protease [Candidatus Peregrinibacteria bacterium Gr01-1014_25]